MSVNGSIVSFSRAARKSLNQSVHNETREKAFKLVKAVLMANFLSMEDGVSYNFCFD